MDNIIHPAALWERLQVFLNQGGEVLIAILLLTFLLWFLILERHYFFWRHYRALASATISQWQMRSDKTSWLAKQTRIYWLSLIKSQSQRNLASIKLVVVIAPLLGLLGTVVGMIDVFDVMATTGSSNARAMAAGVSKATIPTMAGMVASLSGLLFSVSLQRRSHQAVESVANKMILE